MFWCAVAVREKLTRSAGLLVEDKERPCDGAAGGKSATGMSWRAVPG